MLRIFKYAIPVGLVAFLGYLYLRTMPPGLTWAYDGADGGDLITAAATGGVPHPTGYPTYLLIAAAFLRLPLGSLAYRTNLFSAVCMTGAALLIYLIVLKASKSELPATIAGVAFGTFPLAWSQAIITEVNALHALFITLILFWAAGETRGPLGDFLGGLLAGLGMGNHLSTVLALPLLWVSSGSRREGEEVSLVPLGSGLRRVIGSLIGLSVYAIIPLRAAKQAPVNWGNAVDWSGFAWLVTGRMYWERLSDFGASYLWQGFRGWSTFFISQLDMIGLVLILIALVSLFKRSSLFVATGWLALVYSVFAILYDSPDSYVYLIPMLISLAIWIGLAVHWLLERGPAERAALRPIAGVVVLGVYVVRALLAIPAMDRSRDHVAEDFSQKTLQSAPHAAILLTDGDEATFSLWYRHFAYGERPDVAVVATGLLPQQWYRVGLAKTYPGLKLPEGQFNDEWLQADPGRAVCRADIGYGLSCETR